MQLLSLSSSTDFLLSPYTWRKNNVYGSKLLKGPLSCREVRQKAGLFYLLSSSSFLIQKKERVRTASFPSLWFWVHSQVIVDGMFWAWASSTRYTWTHRPQWPSDLTVFSRDQSHVYHISNETVWLYTSVWLHLKPTPSLSLEQRLSFSQETLVSWSYLHTLGAFALSSQTHTHRATLERSDAHKLIISSQNSQND